jgi:hypothetical protein
LSTLQLFRFGGLFGIDAPFTAKGDTGAAACGFVDFGLRASLLPRRWDLAIFFSCQRRPAPQLLERFALVRVASVAGAEERRGRQISRFTQNNSRRSTSIVAAAKSCTSTYRQYIDSRREETRTTFRPRPNLRRRFRGELSEQNPLGVYDFLRSTLSLIHTVGRAPAAEKASGPRRSASFVSDSHGGAC